MSIGPAQYRQSCHRYRRDKGNIFATLMSSFQKVQKVGRRFSSDSLFAECVCLGLLQLGYFVIPYVTQLLVEGSANQLC